MKFHGIQLQEGTVVTNMTVAIGVVFPETPSVGELFFRSDSDQNTRGMYIYGGAGWDRVGTTEVLTSPTGLGLPVEANTGDLFYLNTDDAAEGLYVFNGVSWVKANGTPDNTSTVTGDVTGTVTLGSTSALSLATINAPVVAKGSASKTITVSVDAKGRVTSVDEQNIAVDASQVTSGTFANSRISQSSVTQHQGSLLLAASQINSGTFPDSRISQSSVTQHQAALTISESQISDGTLLARVGANETISGSWTFANPITGQDPTAGVHLATKAYVDTVAAGLDPKGSVRVATTENISLSGSQLVDGVAISAGQRVLVKDQTDATQNGIYVSAAGAWTRASDADSSTKVTPGIFFMVEEGATNADSAWVLVNDGVITLGTTPLNFVRFSGTGQIEAGQGIAKSGNTLSLAQLTDSGVGSLLKISRDAYGRVSGTSAVTLADLSPLLDAQYANATGDTFTGAVTINSTTSNKLILQHPGFGSATIGSDSAGSMIFAADESNAQPATVIVWRTDGAERMRIDTSGNLGVGTSTPTLDGSYKGIHLHNSTASQGVQFKMTNALGSTTADGFAISHTPSGNTYLSNRKSFPIIFETAAIERMRISDNGNVGVGTSSPSSKLEVSNGTNSNGSLKVSATGTASGNFASMNFVTGTAVWTVGTEGNSGRFFVYNNAATTDQLNFSGGANSAAGISALGTAPFVINTAGLERVRVDSNGNLGIGTTAPSAQGLSVVKSGATDAGIQIGNGTASTYLTQSADGNFYLYNYGAYGLIFGTSGAEKMRLDASGNLGVGVTPSVWSTGKAIEIGAIGNSIFGPSANEVNITHNAFFNTGWKYGSTQTAGRYQIQGGAHQWFTAPSGAAGTAISFVQAMTLDTSGNLGIGTTPAYKLDVDHGGSPVRFRNGTTGYGSIALGGSATATNNYQLASDGSGNLIIYRGNPGTGTERVRIDTNGNLAIGASSTSARLLVQGSGTQDIGVFQQSGTANASIVINHADAAGTNPSARPTLSLRKGGITMFNLSCDGNSNGQGATYYDAAGVAAAHAFYTNSTERLRIDAAGNVGVGTAAPTQKLDVAGNLNVSGNITVGGTIGYATGTFQRMLQSTAVASTSGTQVNFTGIESWVKKITIMLFGVSTSGTSQLELRLGTSAGIVNTGYSSVASFINNTTPSGTTSTTGLRFDNFTAAADTRFGTITLLNVTGNQWVMSSTVGLSNATAAVAIGGGGIALSGVLDRIRLVAANGTDTFDAGTVNIIMEG